jgi:hypothetical protein
MADLCPTCGIRLTEGLCQCPEVLLERIRVLTTELEAADALRGGDELAAMRSGENYRRTICSLRAKLMRERADAQVCIADLCEIIEYWQRIKVEPKVAVFRARARRLRAEADRIERGGK